MAGRACQPIEPGDDDHVILAQLIDKARELRPIATGTGDLLLEEPLATCAMQPLALLVEVLVVGGDTRVAQLHRALPAFAEHPAKEPISAREICNGQGIDLQRAPSPSRKARVPQPCRPASSATSSAVATAATPASRPRSSSTATSTWTKPTARSSPGSVATTTGSASRC